MALAYVSGSFATGSNGDGSTRAYAANVAANTLLVCAIRIPSNTATVSGITDTLGNTWARARANPHSSQAMTEELWWAYSASGGANTLTFDWSEVITAVTALMEFTGFTNGVTVDQTNENETSGVSNHPAGSITTTVAESVIIAGFAVLNAFTVSSRETDYFAPGVVSGTHDVQYKISASTETTDGDMTTGTNETVASLIANFYTTVAGGAFTKIAAERFGLAGGRGLVA
jgi:hypothetical protein